MNDILADLAGMQKSPGSPCVRVRIQREHPELLEAFDTAIEHRELSASSVSEWFKDRGVELGDQNVRNHRNGRCMTCRRTS